MDHFIGFDRFLRVCLGREKEVIFFGPCGFGKQVESKLSAYTWNLVGNYASDFTLVVNELHGDGKCESMRFCSRSGFVRESLDNSEIRDGVLLEDPFFRVSFDILDHGIPCLAFAIEEKSHANIWINRIAELGLPSGRWLRAFKDAVLRRDPDDTQIDAGGRMMPLKRLWSAVRIVPGQKIAYVTDVMYDPGNREKIVKLADCADILFIEAMFLQRDILHSSRKRHLTAWQAGEIGRFARARAVVPFHFSPRYAGREHLLRREAEGAFKP
jgi:ribonuclease Z